jgi:hypothetical protein
MGIGLGDIRVDNDFADLDDDDPTDMSNKERIVTINKSSFSQES